MDEQGRIRVAQVIGFAAEGGVESMIMNLYRNIDRSKVQFDFFVECSSKIIRPDKIEEMGGKVVYIPKLKKLILNDRPLVKLLKEGKYDICHANKTTLNFFYLKAAKKAGIKVRISHAHSTTSGKEKIRDLAKKILRLFSKKNATHYFACGEKSGRWMFGNKIFDEGKVYIVNNAIELERFKYNQELRDAMRKELEIENKFVVGHVGRFLTQKNHTFLIDIFFEIQKKRPDSVLLLIGDGPLHQEMVEKTRTLKINHKVIFAGVHKHPERYYQAMDCFVMPSLYEGLPVVGIETQANGLDCFLSDSITREVKVNENVEFLSISSSAACWCDAIVSLNFGLNDRGLGIINFVNSKFDIVRETDLLCKKYVEIVRND